MLLSLLILTTAKDSYNRFCRHVLRKSSAKELFFCAAEFFPAQCPTFPAAELVSYVYRMTPEFRKVSNIKVLLKLARSTTVPWHLLGEELQSPTAHQIYGVDSLLHQDEDELHHAWLVKCLTERIKTIPSMHRMRMWIATAWVHARSKISAVLTTTLQSQWLLPRPIALYGQPTWPGTLQFWNTCTYSTVFNLFMVIIHLAHTTRLKCKTKGMMKTSWKKMA